MFLKLVKKQKIILGLITILFFSISTLSFATINKEINYQGKLFNSNEQPVNDGDYNIKFRLCSTSDCSTVVWSETREGGDKVTIKKGLFSVLLGSVSSLDSVDFNQDLWLGVDVGGVGAPVYDGEMTPRKKLGSVNAAFVSASLKSDVDQNTIEANSINNLLELTQSGTGDIFKVNDEVGDTSPFIVDTDGNISIGGGIKDKDGELGTAGQILSSTGTTLDWVDAPTSASGSIDTHSDVDTTTTVPTNGQVLTWDGTNWVPETNQQDNIYTADGTLTGDRTISLDSNDLYFMDSGRIGIGTSSPSTKLHVVGQVRATSFANANGTAGSPSYRFWSDSNTGMFRAATDQLGFTTGGSERVRIDDSGNVGVGTDMPGYLLDIFGTGHFSGDLTLDAILNDKDGDAGTLGQVLSSTATGIDWIDASTVGTDNQKIDKFNLNGDNLELSLESDGEAGKVIDLSVYKDNTDTLADLSCNNNEITSWDGANWVCVSDDEGTDNQNLTAATINTSNVLTIGIEDGAAVNVDLSQLEHTGTEGSIFFAGADTKPTENNTNLFWDNTNNRLGVGTSAPNSKLDIFSDSGTVYARVGNTDDAGGRLKFGWENDDNYSRITSWSTGGYRPLEIDGSHIKFHVSSSGNIGIGVARNQDPLYKLDVRGNGRFTGNLNLDSGLKDKDGDLGGDGQVLVSTGTQVDWKNNTPNPIPFVSSLEPNSVAPSSTNTVKFNGYNFLPNSAVAISGGNTVNSVNVLSPIEMEVDITATDTLGTYDITISNNGILNTEWTNNGVDLFVVTSENGTTQESAGESCKAILDNGYSTGDDDYWINPDGGSTDNAFEVYCDMTTDGGGWTKIEYTTDFPHEAHFSDGDTSRWLDSDFTLTLTNQQIDDIRAVSTEGKQTYVGTCDGVIHYDYNDGNFGYAFGFRYHNGHETAYEQETYPSTTIAVTADGCETNDDNSTDTIFEINDVRLPVINVHSKDNSSSEEFGSPLTSNPAWLR